MPISRTMRKETGGNAKDFVAMKNMLQQAEPKDYVIGTGYNAL